MGETCSLEEAGFEIGVSPNHVLKIIIDHPGIFSGVDTRANPSGIQVPVSALQAFKRLYENGLSLADIADRLGVSAKRIQKVRQAPGVRLLERSFCCQQTCPVSGRPRARRKFPGEDAEKFIEYCETRGIFKVLQSSAEIRTFTYTALEKAAVVSASRAFRYKDAVRDGLNPQAYRSSDIAPGEYMGKLVFKVWGGRSRIQCFFVLENDDLIRLTAFRPHATPWRGYTPRDGRVDFSGTGIEGGRYRITTGLTRQGAVSFLSAGEIG